MRLAYEYVMTTGGITFEDFYRYNPSAHTCDSSKNDYTVTVVNHYRIRGEQKMINYVLAGGTFAAAVDARGLSSYKSGIYSGCGPKYNISHDINIVGGTELSATVGAIDGARKATLNLNWYVHVVIIIVRTRLF